MKKKFAAMFMAAAMVFTMAACGQKADTPSTPDADGSGDQSGAEVQTFVLGSCGPLTGSAAIYGQAVKNAEELAVKEINAANGSDVFEWKFEDDEHDAEKSVNAYNTLKDWGLQVLAGPVTTTPSIAVAAETANDNLFMMTPSASAPTVIESGDNVFQICFTDPNQGVASADYIADNKLGTKVGIIYDSSDAYSSGIYEKFKAEAAAKNLEIVTAEAFTADNKAQIGRVGEHVVEPFVEQQDDDRRDPRHADPHQLLHVEVREGEDIGRALVVRRRGDRHPPRQHDQHVQQDRPEVHSVKDTMAVSGHTKGNRCSYS